MVNKNDMLSVLVSFTFIYLLLLIYFYGWSGYVAIAFADKIANTDEFSKYYNL